VARVSAAAGASVARSGLRAPARCHGCAGSAGLGCPGSAVAAAPGWRLLLGCWSRVRAVAL